MARSNRNPPPEGICRSRHLAEKLQHRPQPIAPAIAAIAIAEEPPAMAIIAEEPPAFAAIVPEPNAEEPPAFAAVLSKPILEEESTKPVI